MAEFIDKTIEVASGVYNDAKTGAVILAEKAKIKELYYKLGKEYYASLSDDTFDVSKLDDICREIKTRLKKIAALKSNKQQNAHVMKVCEECGCANPEGNSYCGKCGKAL